MGCKNILEFVKPLDLTEGDIKKKEMKERDKQMKKVIEKFQQFNSTHFNWDFLYN